MNLMIKWFHHYNFRCLILLCVGLSLAACKVELYNNLNEREANEIVSVLLENGIAASRQHAKDDKLTVLVEESYFSEAVKLLTAHGLPNEKFATMGEIFSGEGLVSSPFEERARLIYALSQELSRTISDIDGVLSARIHVVLPDNDPLSANDTPSSASVFIRHQSDVAIGDLMPQIKIFVANSIEGLIYKNVSVVLVPVDMQNMQSVSGSGSVKLTGYWVNDLGADRLGLLIYLLGAIAALALLGNAFLFWRLRRRSHGTSPLLQELPSHAPAE